MAAASPSRALPSRARIVIIGGGVGGVSVAHHLAERGECDVLLVERAELTSGSTFHSAGLVGQLRADPALTRMNVHSVRLYRELETGEHAAGWVESGSLRLASSPERLAEIRRQHGWARRSGLPLEIVSADDAAELFPLMSTDGVLGAAYLPTDGQIDPARLCTALAARARAAGVAIAQRTRVLAVDTAESAAGRRVTGVRTDRGDVECEVVVDCGGMFAAEIGRLVDVRIPVVPMSHQYVVTEPFLTGALPDRTAPLPSLRDPDLLVYYRQEIDGLVMGGYERRSAPFTATARSYDAVPGDFNGRLLPFDWDRFTPIAENAQIRVPALADVGVAAVVNGPEAFTPDNEFCLGETGVDGFFVAAGFCAHGIAGAGGVGLVTAAWILDGDPGMDLTHMDVRRFARHHRSPGYTLARTVANYESYYDIRDIRRPGPSRAGPRPLRRSPAHPWQVSHGAVFTEEAGWARVEHYGTGDGSGEPEGSAGTGLRPDGAAGEFWPSAVEPEHRAARETVALADESSAGTFAISGPDAAAFVTHVFAGPVDRPPGAVVRTPALTDRGGIACDALVTRLSAAEFLVVTGTSSAPRDLEWLRGRARSTGAAVGITDVTGGWVGYGLWGPRADAVLDPLTPPAGDLPGGTARDTTVGDVPVLALRTTPVGEQGWTLLCPAEYGAALWETLVEAGAEHGLRPVGARAAASLRLEAGHRVWGADIGPDTSPDEAGLGSALRPGGGFAGWDALLAARARGVTRRLCRLELDDPRTVTAGGEPVAVVVGGRAPEEVAGHVTSAGYGWSLGRSLAHAYLPAAVAPGSGVAVEVGGARAAGRVVPWPRSGPGGSTVG